VLRLIFFGNETNKHKKRINNRGGRPARPPKRNRAPPRKSLLPRFFRGKTFTQSTDGITFSAARRTAFRGIAANSLTQGILRESRRRSGPHHAAEHRRRAVLSSRRYRSGRLPTMHLARRLVYDTTDNLDCRPLDKRDPTCIKIIPRKSWLCLEEDDFYAAQNATQETFFGFESISSDWKQDYHSRMILTSLRKPRLPRRTPLTSYSRDVCSDALKETLNRSTGRESSLGTSGNSTLVSRSKCSVPSCQPRSRLLGPRHQHRNGRQDSCDGRGNASQADRQATGEAARIQGSS
jgi:hypothetical protein